METHKTTTFWADLKTIPNLLSVARILGVLVAAVLYLEGYRIPGLLLGGLAGATDILDGWLARKLNQTTDLGAILDRLCDLVFETVGFVFVIHFRLLPPLFFVVYLLREFVVISARLYVAERGKTIPSSSLGKGKTNLVSGCFIGLLAMHSGLVGPEIGGVLYKVGYAMMVGGLFLSYVSGYQYTRVFVRIYGER